MISKMFGKKFKKSLLFSLVSFSLLAIPAVSVAKVFEKPTVSVEAVRLNDLSLKSIDLVIILNVNNPNILGVDLSRVEYTVNINEVEKVFEGLTEKEIKISKQSAENLVEVPLSIQNNKLLTTLVSIAKSPKEINYQVQGKAHFKTFLGNIPIPFQKNGKIDNSETFAKIKKQLDSIKMFLF